MSTRGLYTFKGASQRDSWNVYKHSDNYPTGAAEAITLALEYAWQLPRYEADEFAAAFIAANKSYWHRRELEVLRQLKDGAGSAGNAKLRTELENNARYAIGSGGNVRLMPQGKPLAVAQKHCCDIQYRYEIYKDEDKQHTDRQRELFKLRPVPPKLHVKAFAIGGDWNNLTEELIYCGNLDGFAAWAKRNEKAA